MVRMTFKLLDGSIISLDVAKESFVVGRSSKCDMVVPSDDLSREHCKIQVENGEIFITDLGSSNGVLIDDKKILPHIKTLYRSSLSLSLGGIEVAKLEIGLDQTDTSIPMIPTDDVSISTIKSAVKTPIRTPSPNRYEVKNKDLNPKIKNLFILVAIVFLYFVYTRFQGSDESQSFAPSKRVRGDGTVRTKNF